MLLDRIVDPVRIVLLVLTILIVIVAAISILVSIYNSMSERSHDIAVMRALGASRTAVMGIILVESILLSVLGGLLGVLLGHAMIGLASPYVVERTGVLLNVFQFDWKELTLIPALVVLASLVGLLPALALMVLPFLILWALVRLLPPWPETPELAHDAPGSSAAA